MRILAILATLTANCWPLGPAFAEPRHGASIILDAWVVSTGKHQGNPLIVRRNRPFKSAQTRKVYPTRAGIAFKLLAPRADGWPTDKELAVLAQIETFVVERFQIEDRSVVVVILTTSGFREFMLYTKDKASVTQHLAELRARFPAYSFTTYFRDDKEWRGYHEFE